MPKKQAERKPVHLVFGPHERLAQYMQKPERHLRQLKTFVYEEAHGDIMPISLQELLIMRPIMSRSRKRPQGHSYAEQQTEILIKALQRGIKIKPGELFKSVDEQKKYKQLLDESEEAHFAAKATRELEHIKRFVDATARFNKFRHQLIRRTIAASEKPLLIRYGAGHSSLSQELRREGIETSREMTPKVFNYQDIAIRKRMLGKTLSDGEYKKALVAEILEEWLGKWSGKSSYASGMQFLTLVNTTLLNRIPNDSLLLDRAIRSGAVREIFQANGLPEKPNRTELRAFLNQHSSFWKRQQAIRRTKRVKSPA
jgi:hypothetical protein